VASAWHLKGLFQKEIEESNFEHITRKYERENKACFKRSLNISKTGLVHLENYIRNWAAFVFRNMVPTCV
jgi:hypothetical protein